MSCTSGREAGSLGHQQDSPWEWRSDRGGHGQARAVLGGVIAQTADSILRTQGQPHALVPRDHLGQVGQQTRRRTCPRQAGAFLWLLLAFAGICRGAVWAGYSQLTVLSLYGSLEGQCSLASCMGRSGVGTEASDVGSCQGRGSGARVPTRQWHAGLCEGVPRAEITDLLTVLAIDAQLSMRPTANVEKKSTLFMLNQG